MAQQTPVPATTTTPINASSTTKNYLISARRREPTQNKLPEQLLGTILVPKTTSILGLSTKPKPHQCRRDEFVDFRYMCQSLSNDVDIFGLLKQDSTQTTRTSYTMVLLTTSAHTRLVTSTSSIHQIHTHNMVAPLPVLLENGLDEFRNRAWTVMD
jgi:hypothetical protein